MCVRSECSFVVGAADAREVSVADAGEVACGTPELLGAGRSVVCGQRKGLREASALMNSVGGFLQSECRYVCTCALNWILHSSFLIPEKNPQVPQEM